MSIIPSDHSHRADLVTSPSVSLTVLASLSASLGLLALVESSPLVCWPINVAILPHLTAIAMRVLDRSVDCYQDTMRSGMS